MDAASTADVGAGAFATQGGVTATGAGVGAGAGAAGWREL